MSIVQTKKYGKISQEVREQTRGKKKQLEYEVRRDMLLMVAQNMVLKSQEGKKKKSIYVWFSTHRCGASLCKGDRRW